MRITWTIGALDGLVVGGGVGLYVVGAIVPLHEPTIIHASFQRLDVIPGSNPETPHE